MELEKITEQVCELSRETAVFIQQEVKKLRGADIETKGIHNFVTYVDKGSEEKLLKGLSKILPGTGFIAEESPELEMKERNWVIDPLDGTTNFIHGVPVYSISIALMEKSEVILGVILEVNQDECFYTWKGAPSMLNGKRILVSETTRLSDSLLATGFPYYDYSRLGPYMNLFRYLMEYSHGIRRLGSAAADLAYVACGRFEGFYEYGLSPWDVAAGTILVKNAGGRVSDFTAGENYIFGKEIVATNDPIYNEFMKVLKEQFAQ
ncbi:MAG: inositol monophosphatase family protein [Bacteroidetes bacterium]|nr:inositol monophosphatase family protein [Bacteroidota bacterium]